jgi:enoyl-CoA hydratase
MTSNYKTICCEVLDGVCVLKFNRPKVSNALSFELLEELKAAVEEVAADQNIRVLVLTGEGDKAFVAGADVGPMKDFTPLEARKFSQFGQGIFCMLESLPIPVIACVNGFALGGGGEVAMACDLVYAADTAKFGQPEINLGLIPALGGTQRLSRLVGRNRTLELCLTGRTIDAKEAFEIGMINRVIPANLLWDETMKVASDLASKGRVAVRTIKNAIRKGVDRDIEIGCQLESDGLGVCLSGEDAKEGIRAFIEKRKPRFKDNL